MIRLRVVSALYHPSLGGLGRQAKLLTEALAASDLSVRVLARRMRGLPPANFLPAVEVRRLGGPFQRRHILEERSATNLLISLSFAVRCAAVLWRERRQFDLVHFHGASLPLLVSLPFLKASRKPVVAKVAAANLGSEVGSLSGRYAGLGSLLARVGRRADAYVAISDEIRDGLFRDGIREDQVFRIDNFVDTSHFRPPTVSEREHARASVADESRKLVVWTGRLVSRKGVRELLAAWERVVERDLSAQLLLVGDGPERRGLEHAASRLVERDQVRFLGHVEDPVAPLHAADLFVLSSSTEGMPNSLLEAMACGLPSVAFRIGGVTDLARAGAGIVLVEPGDTMQLAAVILALLADTRHRAVLGGASIGVVTTRFRLEQRIEEYRDLYERFATGS